MKRKTTKLIMSQLVTYYGGGETCHDKSRGIKIVAGMLGIRESWAYMILKGKKKPGNSLWKLMQKEAEEVDERQKR